MLIKKGGDGGRYEEYWELVDMARANVVSAPGALRHFVAPLHLVLYSCNTTT